MTNQEIIANLNMIRVAFVEPVTKEQRKLIDDTFDNAIKELKQKPIKEEQALLQSLRLPPKDYLDEYGHWDIDAIDDAIEVIDWVPLPTPYEPQERSDKE